MSQQRRNRVGLLLVVGCLVVVGAFSKPADKPVMDIERYQTLMAERVESVEELQDLYLAERDEYLAILPPVEDFILRQAGIPELLPFDPQTFPTEFLKKLAPVKENSVSIYPLTLAEDGVTRETYFLNAEGQEVYALPPLKDYDPYVYLEERYSDLFQTAYDSELLTTLKNLYDPARIEIEVRLIDVDDLPAYLFAQARIAEAAAELKLDSE